MTPLKLPRLPRRALIGGASVVAILSTAGLAWPSSTPPAAAIHALGASQPSVNVAPAVTGTAPTPGITLGTSDAAVALRDRVAKALRGSTAGVIGMRVDVAGLGTVSRRRGATDLPPASTEKLFTAATVLTRIGADTRLHTRFRLYGHRSGHRLVGHLVVVGGGDPTFTSARLHRIAKRIRGTGITEITGGILVDAHRYDTLHTAQGWKPDFVPDETGPLSAIVLDWNTYSSLAVSHPERAAGGATKHALRKAGVTVDGSVEVGPDPGGRLVESFHSISSPVGDIVRTMLQESINYYAEQLLKELAARTGQPGSTDGGIALVREQGDTLGVPVTSQLADGSGLSRLDRQTPDTEVAWLEQVASSPIGSQLRHSLSVACVVGTLRYRMCGTAAAGRVWAKTGTLDHVHCLAGYTWTRSGRRATFSFLLSEVGNGSSATAAIDRAVEALASFDR